MTEEARPADELLRLYRQMLLIRKCEEQLAKSHQRGLVHGACHTYVGQEAIATGVCAHLRDDDVVFSTHRGHGHALAKGMPPAELIAELFGRDTGWAGTSFFAAFTIGRPSAPIGTPPGGTGP